MVQSLTPVTTNMCNTILYKLALKQKPSASYLLVLFPGFGMLPIPQPTHRDTSQNDNIKMVSLKGQPKSHFLKSAG